MQNLKRKVDYLSGQEDDINSEISESRPQKRPKKEVEVWLTDVQRFKDEVQRLEQEVVGETNVFSRKRLGSDIVKKIQEASELQEKGRDFNGLNKKWCGGWFPDLLTRPDLLSLRIDELQVGGRLCKSKKKKKKKVGGRFDNVAFPMRRPIDVESTMSTEGFVAFESMRKAMDEAMEALKDDRVKIVGVYGMGGVGKTTMVKQVGVKAQKEGLFDYVIMAVVSQNVNLRRIQGQLADMLALGLHEESEFGRAGRLKEKIMRTKKILIILDDIWTRVELSEIGIPSGSDLEACKSKILLTTRTEHACFTMGSQAKIHLDVASEEDSWTLFRSKAGEVVEYHDFHDVARRVAKQCGGLPIALVVAARALGDKELFEWEEAARQLEMSTFKNLDEDEKVFKCIKLSYDYLKGNDAKLCFVICCLFPEDTDIRIFEDLVKYGIGHGLFQDANTMNAAKARALSVTRHLQASCLLLESEQEECVKMHDVVRDMGILIASSGGEHAVMVKAGIGLKEWPREENYRGCTAISLMYNEITKLPDQFVCSRLQTLLLQNNSDVQEIPDAFFEEAKSLRVLDFSSADIQLLPSSLGLLTNLGTLCLNCCQSITDISILGKLKKLEILSLRESCIEELPQEVGELGNLRMLDLTLSNDIKQIPPNVISRLSNLEELYMQGSFAEWGQAVEGTENGTNAGLDELTCLPRLNVLKVDICGVQCMPNNVALDPNWIKFNICIHRDKFTRSFNVQLSKPTTVRPMASLVLDTTINTLPDWFNKVVTEKVEKILYIECGGLNNILTAYDRARLSGLKSILIQQCYGVHLMDSVNWVPSMPVFENLVELSINNMDYLNQICVGQLPHGSLAKLKFFDVQQCNELADVLLQSNLLQRLQNLEVLNVSANSLEEIFRTEQLEEGQIVLQKLREMKLDNLPKLARIWNGPSRLAIFHNLKVLTLIKCKKLGSLFTQSVSRCLLQLEDLWIADCVALEGIIGKDDQGEATSIQSPSSQFKMKENGEKHEEEVMDKIIFPQLKNLLLQNLPCLRSFYSGDAAIECPSLEQVHVQDCPYFGTSISDFNRNKTIQFNNEQHFILLQKRIWELRQIS
ncbi:probable disease resistance protein At4g27220 isoform X2 [Rhododendron vialii]|nr:probable disease resistance protein At4g27220 isoform X2 [Rhododendron vialii]XP_058183262.1 probable disease resistance protein At4g27220 isoform X2 [Rhododendron vialii]